MASSATVVVDTDDYSIDFEQNWHNENSIQADLVHQQQLDFMTMLVNNAMKRNAIDSSITIKEEEEEEEEEVSSSQGERDEDEDEETGNNNPSFKEEEEDCDEILIEWSTSPTATTASASIGAFRGKHKPMGRKATPIKYIENYKKRSVTFSKRKKGIMNKVFQIVHMTGCNAFVIIQQVPSISKEDPEIKVVEEELLYSIQGKNNKRRNTYAYACETWRSLFYREETVEFLSKPFEPNLMMDSSIPYTPTKTLPEETCPALRVKTIGLKDKLSTHVDAYCNATFGKGKRRGPGSDFVILDQDDENIEDCSDTDDEEAATAAPMEEKAKKRKPRGAVVVKFIEDKKKRGTCFCKRKFGLVSKAYEIVGQTGCRCLIILSYPEQEGGSDMYHIYASPDWRAMAMSDRFLNMLRETQRLESPVLDFFAPKKITNPPVYITEDAKLSNSYSKDYFRYHLPTIAFQSKIHVNLLPEQKKKPPAPPLPVLLAAPSEELAACISDGMGSPLLHSQENINDAFICFVWKQPKASTVTTTKTTITTTTTYSPDIVVTTTTEKIKKKRKSKKEEAFSLAFSNLDQDLQEEFYRQQLAIYQNQAMMFAAQMPPPPINTELYATRQPEHEGIYSVKQQEELHITTTTTTTEQQQHYGYDWNQHTQNEKKRTLSSDKTSVDDIIEDELIDASSQQDGYNQTNDDGPSGNDSETFARTASTKHISKRPRRNNEDKDNDNNNNNNSNSSIIPLQHHTSSVDNPTKNPLEENLTCRVDVKQYATTTKCTSGNVLSPTTKAIPSFSATPSSRPSTITTRVANIKSSSKRASMMLFL